MFATEQQKRQPIHAVTVITWIDSEIKVIWNIQKEDGIIEGWYGDGNFARTSIKYGLWENRECISATLA